MPALKPGTVAPPFKLHSTPDQYVSLSDFKGTPVILVFFPADWSPVCSDQLTLYNEVISEFKNYNAELLAISVDGIWCHLAFEEKNSFNFPLLSDFEPKGKVAKSYGVYDEDDGICERALFVIDGKGVISWSYVSPMGINPGAEGILAALADLAKNPIKS